MALFMTDLTYALAMIWFAISFPSPSKGSTLVTIKFSNVHILKRKASLFLSINLFQCLTDTLLKNSTSASRAILPALMELVLENLLIRSPMGKLSVSVSNWSSR